LSNFNENLLKLLFSDQFYFCSYSITTFKLLPETEELRAGGEVIIVSHYFFSVSMSFCPFDVVFVGEKRGKKVSEFL